MLWLYRTPKRWQEWYRYITLNQTGEILYGNRILILPNVNPDSTKNLQWVTNILLLEEGSYTLAGPFKFKPIT